MIYDDRILKRVFSNVFPSNPDKNEWISSLAEVLPDYEVNNEFRIAAFIAQCGHETAGFTRLSENLNYSSKHRILIIFGNRINDPTDVEELVNNPEKLANVIYGNRMGNGPPYSGDGWLFRGRGCLHLTGRENYQRFADAVGLSLNAAIRYVETRDGAVESACWYWNDRKLNAFADSGDFNKLTRAINGGLNGINERRDIYNKALNLLIDNRF